MISRSSVPLELESTRPAGRRPLCIRLQVGLVLVHRARIHSIPLSGHLDLLLAFHRLCHPHSCGADDGGAALLYADKAGLRAREPEGEPALGAEAEPEDGTSEQAQYDPEEAPAGRSVHLLGQRPLIRCRRAPLAARGGSSGISVLATAPPQGIHRLIRVSGTRASTSESRFRTQRLCGSARQSGRGRSARRIMLAFPHLARCSRNVSSGIHESC